MRNFIHALVGNGSIVFGLLCPVFMLLTMQAENGKRDWELFCGWAVVMTYSLYGGYYILNDLAQEKAKARD